MKRKHFTEDFRKEAVRLALNSDFSRHQVADDLGVGHSTLGKSTFGCMASKIDALSVKFCK